MVRLALLAILMIQVIINFTSATESECYVESLARRVTQLESRMTRRERSVFFTARMSTSPVNTGTASALRFDTVVSNEGNAYNSNTGVFTAPVAGDYVFYAQIMSETAAGGWFTFVIDKSGTTLCLNEPNSSATYMSASCHAATHLAAGEQVIVRRDGENSVQQIHGGAWCSFSGFLLRATE